MDINQRLKYVDTKLHRSQVTIGPNTMRLQLYPPVHLSSSSISLQLLLVHKLLQGERVSPQLILAAILPEVNHKKSQQLPVPAQQLELTNIRLLSSKLAVLHPQVIELLPQFLVIAILTKPGGPKWSFQKKTKTSRTSRGRRGHYYRGTSEGLCGHSLSRTFPKITHQKLTIRTVPKVNASTT